MIKTVLLDIFGLTHIAWSESNKNERRTIPHFTTFTILINNKISDNKETF